MVIYEKGDIEQRLQIKSGKQVKQKFKKIRLLVWFGCVLMVQLCWASFSSKRSLTAVSVNYFNQINANSGFTTNQPAAAIRKTGID